MMSWLEQLITLHRDKDAAYGDAWCRRGEAAGIFPNIARKYDRWARINSQPTPDASVIEPLEDTLADLCIYAVKYLLWLRQRHPAAASDLPPGIDTVDAALTLIAHQDLMSEGDRILSAAFARLEHSFLDPAPADPADRACHTWDLARSAWTLLQPLPARHLGGATAAPAEAAPGPAAVGQLVDDSLAGSAVAADLLGQLVGRVARHPGPVLLLGRTGTALHLIAGLHRLGLAQHVVGVADPDLQATQEPGSIEWATLQNLPLRYLVVCSDADKERLLRSFISVRSAEAALPTVVLTGTQHLAFTDPVYAASDAPALVPSYATGYPNTRIHMFQHLQAAARSGLSGAIVEFGAFKGGTTAWLARTAQLLGLSVPILAFDSWDGFPPRRSLLDLYKHPRCVFRDLPAVKAYLEPLGVQLIAGDISDTAAHLHNTPVLLAFIDTDNYSPARAALSAVADNIVAGGAIVFDHYTTGSDYLYTLGERMAGQDVLAGRGFLNIHDSGLFLRMPDATGEPPPIAVPPAPDGK